MAIDTNAVMQRVIQRAVAASVGNEALAASLDSQQTEELIADVLGKRLAQMFASDASQPSDTNGSSLPDHSARELARCEKLLARCEELEDRNSALAAALGACDCWGEEADCAVCQGAGMPGWALPERRMFLKFVSPALKTVRKSRPSPAPSDVKQQDA